MIEQKFNYNDVFLRDLTVCVLAALENKLTWINRFEDGDVNVAVPFYYSLSGSEDFLLDSFSDDIVSNNRHVELNTDQYPRGHVTLTNWRVKGEEFANPNVWLRMVVENQEEIKKILTQVRALPITATYEMTVLVNSEIDAFKASQSIMNMFWLWKFMYFEYNFMNIEAVMIIPDEQTLTINREKNLSSDDAIKLDFTFEVHTYYPAYNPNTVIDKGEQSGIIPSFGNSIENPKRVRWINQIRGSERDMGIDGDGIVNDPGSTLDDSDKPDDQILP